VSGADQATAIIAAAGSGERLGAGGPKALIPVAGRPMLEWSLQAMRDAKVAAIVIAAPPGAEAAFESDGVRVVSGGATRSESVALALAAVESELVVVHDAARPLVTAQLVEDVLTVLSEDPELGAVVAAAPVTDTIKHVARGREVDSTLDRSALWAAQTPQAFRSEALREAHASTALLAQATDDAMLVERLGRRVVLHQASEENLKVTVPADLAVAELLLGRR
jgi:2-C-methyl-D-erythritol 4-phosphate cytidylyltransferase